MIENKIWSSWNKMSVDNLNTRLKNIQEKYIFETDTYPKLPVPELSTKILNQISEKKYIEKLQSNNTNTIQTEIIKHIKHAHPVNRIRKSSIMEENMK